MEDLKWVILMVLQYSFFPVALRNAPHHASWKNSFFDVIRRYAFTLTFCTTLLNSVFNKRCFSVRVKTRSLPTVTNLIGVDDYLRKALGRPLLNSRSLQHYPRLLDYVSSQIPTKSQAVGPYRQDSGGLQTCPSYSFYAAGDYTTGDVFDHIYRCVAPHTPDL